MADGDDSFLARWSRRKAEARGDRRDEAADEAEATVAARSGPGPANGAPPTVVAPVRPAPTAAEASEAAAAPVAEPGTSAQPSSAPPSAQSLPPSPAPAPPTLADVAALTRESDYSRFVAGDVAPDVKNAALRKLFSDPHFNVMDGLDTYIDDYGKPDPLPPGMLRKMVQSQLLGLFADKPALPPADTPARSSSPSLEAAGDAPDAIPVDAQDHAPAGADPDRPLDGADTPELPAADADPAVRGPSAAAAREQTPAHEDTDLQLQPDDAAGRPGDRAGAEPDPRRER